MIETIEKLVHIVPAFSVTENGSTIHDYFEKNKEAEGVVIIEEEKPVGLLMRHNFYQKIGRQFGYSLYMKRDVTLLMKQDITCVEKSCDMAGFGYIAMSRNQDSIYDFIIILEDGKYAGIVSISEFLIEMSKTKEREIQLLNDQQRILKQANEAEKLHRHEIEQKNAAIKNLLDHAGQGFLFFGNDLIISDEYSKECDGIFGFPIGSRMIADIMKRFVDADCIQMMQNVFENVFVVNDPVRNKVYLSILPAEIKIGRRYIQTEYKVIPDKPEKSVMMILTDITEKRALELKTAEEKDNIRLIIRAIGSKSEINQSIDDLREFFKRDVPQLLDNSPDPKSALQNIYRLIHTMKGDFSLNSLHHTAAELHRLEDTFSEMLKNIETVSIEMIRDFTGRIDCNRLLEQDISVIVEALGTHYFEKDDTCAVSRQRIMEIENKIKACLQNEEQIVFLSLFQSLFHTNLKDIIKDYNDYIKTLSKRFGKSIGEIQIVGDDIYINRDRYLPFLKSLVHVFRNMADHGIEDPEERACIGKPETGEVSCILEKSEERFLLSLADDGRGIDPDAIRKKALEKGIYSEDEISSLSVKQVLETIFFDDFTTKEKVDLYSGRGVGLSAVYTKTKEIGGEIIIDSVVGQYTKFTFILPLFNHETRKCLS